VSAEVLGPHFCVGLTGDPQFFVVESCLQGVVLAEFHLGNAGEAEKPLEELIEEIVTESERT